MKKIKFWLPIIGVALLFNSCLLQAIYPFYTSNLIHFEPDLVGKWTDDACASWEIMTLKEYGGFDIWPSPYELNKLKKAYPNFTEEAVINLYYKQNHFDKAYIVKFTYTDVKYSPEFEETDTIEVFSLAMPFKINNHFFLDFRIFRDETQNGLHITELFYNHATPNHSLAKVDVISKDQFNIRSLTDEDLKTLVAEHKIKIKHEKIDLEDKILLTASSEELVKFIEKYMKSEYGKNWAMDNNYSRLDRN